MGNSAGATIAVVAGVVVFVFLLLCWCSKCRRTRYDDEESGGGRTGARYREPYSYHHPSPSKPQPAKLRNQKYDDPYAFNRQFSSWERKNGR